MTAMRLKRYPSPSGGFALGKMGVGATMLKQGKTARDYVQDGLIAMWDGIENAGWGVHDPNATVWTNLIEGNDTLPMRANWSFRDNSVYIARRNSVNTNIPSACFRTAYQAEKWHAEMALYAEMTDINSDAGFIIYNQKFGLWMKPTPILTTRNVANQVTLCSSPSGINFGIRVSSEDSHYVEFFKNGSLFVRQQAWGGTDVGPLSSIAPTQNPSCGFDMRIYSWRIYSRALTAEEIAHNYAIDKERFNLP